MTYPSKCKSFSIFAIIIYKRHFQDEKELDYQSFLGHSHVGYGDGGESASGRYACR